MDEREKKMPPFGGPQGGPPRGDRPPFDGPRGRRPEPEFEDEKQQAAPASEENSPEEKA